MFFLVLGILTLLPHTTAGSIKVAESYWTLKSNVLVVDADVTKYGGKVLVPLECGEAFEGQNVTWRGESGEKLQEQTNRVYIKVEEHQGGNYTCSNTEGRYLNHTMVLVQWPYRKIITYSPEKGYVYCLTNNYSGLFSCFWRWDGTRTGKVALIKITRSHSMGNLSCSLDSRAGSISCRDHAFCPYAEELDHINLTIYFQSSYVIETYHLQFKISDIVRPDKVRIQKRNRMLELLYPDGWNTPFSYFPLTFQVKEIRCRKKSDCDCSNHRSSKVNLTQERRWPLKRGVTVCVRAQDDLCNSSWGKWNKYKCTKETNKRKYKEMDPRVKSRTKQKKLKLMM